jgi:hypothetical protein
MFANWHGRLDVAPQRPAIEQPRPWQPIDLGELGRWTFMGEARLRPGTADRRQAHAIAIGDANDPRLDSWPILASSERLASALDALARERGAAQATESLERIAREAGERWAYRAGLERKWGDGRRAH